MSILLSKGSDTLDNSEKGGANSGKKVGFIRLKNGQSVRVAFIADRAEPENVVFASAEYLNHGDFEQGVHSHPCIHALGEGCHSCDVKVPRSRRFVIPFVLLDKYVNGKTTVEAGTVGVLDVSKKQYNTIKAAVKDYLIADEDDGTIALFDMAFKLAKTGEKTESSFAISPILKLKGEDKEVVEATKEVELEEDFFELALRIRTNDQLKEMLKNYTPKADDEDEDEQAEQSESEDPAKNF
ncbi:hypothetical protein [Paenibacillus hexagrammi]|uniref:Single-stranded DNA-binding protein n=1 Tax=Paenibacillus hexagrammi TaxID=2908839 RepID=A0ABY3SSG7_9BACL|nr:hypothetical protein [Paenibacillus sp. YPD9-1]UJF36589.1 hypothetical protein L0M14_30335 [Paenibacillus sp. YPD9-1]